MRSVMQTQHEDHAVNNFDALRLIAAWLVIVGHSFELLGRGDPLHDALKVESLGAIGVIMFFAMSGYLVTLSLLRTPSIGEFLWKRALRILPALWVLIAVSVFVWGAALTRFDLLTYYTSLTTQDYLVWMFLRIRQYLPGTFENNPLQQGFNGSLWTLPLEARCYFVLALCAVARKRWLKWLVALTLIGIAVVAFRHFGRGVFRVKVFTIDSYLFLKLVVPFFLGSAIALWGTPRWCRVWFGVFSLAAISLWIKFAEQAPVAGWLVFAMCVGYLALGVALHTHGWFTGITRHGDFSYGLYLYAFPVQQTLISFFPLISVAVLIAATTAFTGFFAYLSWRFVEAPMLAEKSRLSAWLLSLRNAFQFPKAVA